MFVKGENRPKKNNPSESMMAARVKREEIIQNALDNGALVHKTSGSLSEDERETLIRLDYLTGLAFIDSSIPSDITKFINRGWKITSITRSVKDNSIQAMTFVGPASKFSIRSVSSGSDGDDVDDIDAADDTDAVDTNE
jgi:hypothetical protein